MKKTFLINKIIKEEVERYFNEISELDLPNSLIYSPNPPLTKSGEQRHGRYPKEDIIQQMIKNAKLTPISMNETKVAYRGSDKDGSIKFNTEPKFGKGLYLTPEIDIAKKYGSEIYRYEIKPKKTFSTPKFKKTMNYQIWSLQISKKYGSKQNWIQHLKSEGFDMIEGWNPALNQWEYIIIDESIINKVDKLEELNKENLDNDIKSEVLTLNFFDFDKSLANTLDPEIGKKEYENITGKKYPHIGWWSKPESLEVFDVEIYPNMKLEYKKRSEDINSKSFLLTNRIKKLSSIIESILDNEGVFFDGYDYSSGKKDKGERIKYYIDEYPTVRTINIYDDREDQISIFKNLKKELIDSNIEVNIFKCKNGSFFKTN